MLSSLDHREDVMEACPSSCNNTWGRQSSPYFAAKSLHLRFWGSPSYGFRSQHTCIWMSGMLNKIRAVKGSYELSRPTERWAGSLEYYRNPRASASSEAFAQQTEQGPRGLASWECRKLVDLVPSPEMSQLATRGQHGENP